MPIWEIHPALVHFPLAFLLGGWLVDQAAMIRRRSALKQAASSLMVAGVLSGAIAAVFGVIAYLTVPAHSKEIHMTMYWHMSAAIASLTLFLGAVLLRRNAAPNSPLILARALAFVASTLLLSAGYLGGQLVFHGGTGVDPELLAEEIRDGHTHASPEGAEPQTNDHHESAQVNDHSKHGDSVQEEQHDHGNQEHADHSAGSLQPAARSPEEIPAIPEPLADAAFVPAGYRVEIFLTGLFYPTSIEFDDKGNAYIAEGGFIYGDEIERPRIIRVASDGRQETITQELNAPVTDLLWHDGHLYISHRGKISVLEDGSIRDLITGLPSLGDHHNNQMTIGPDGKLYFGQGVATNSGVVGLDNFRMGWLAKYPDVHDIPAKDIRLTRQSFRTPDPFTLFADSPAQSHAGHSEQANSHQETPAEEAGHSQHEAEEPRETETEYQHETDQRTHEEQRHAAHAGDEQDNESDDPERQEQSPQEKRKSSHANHDVNDAAAPSPAETAETFGFQPFNKTPPDQGALRGEIKANGTILRVNLDGSDLEVFAWGLRNPFALLWTKGKKLIASDNGYDERGSRPIAHAPDVIWEIKQGAWYGFPDYAAGIPVTDAAFRPENKPAPKFLMRDHPQVEKPVITLTHHVGAAKLEGGNERFGFSDDLFLALFGDMNPITGMHEERSGFEVLRVDLSRGQSETFFKAKKESLGPKGLEYAVTPGPRRPVDVRISPSGDSLYVVDIGAMAVVSTAAGPSPRPFPGTGVIWKITRAK